jgi:hypothetical protein
MEWENGTPIHLETKAVVSIRNIHNLKKKQSGF